MELNNIFAKYFIPSTDARNEDSHICSKCGGRCCKNMGCHISPNDLKEISVQSIIALIDETKCISIDWWEGNPKTNERVPIRVYYLRIRNKGKKVIEHSFGDSRCILLTEDGCPLLFSYRPKGARQLVPVSNAIECDDNYTKQQCSIEWMEYQDVMRKVYKHYRALGEEDYDYVSTDTAINTLMKLLFGE